MKQLKYISRLWHCGIYITDVLFAAFMAVSCVSLAAPPVGSSGGANTTISDLGCALGEIARVTDVEEWDCDPGLTAVEAETVDLNGRLTTIEGQNLDSRVSTIEGQNLNSQLTTLKAESDNIDGRVTTLEGQNLDARIDKALDVGNNAHDYALFLDIRLRTLESQDLDIRLSGLEAENAGDRLYTLESKNLDSRISTLENSSLQFNHVVTVSAMGPTAIDNGLELLAAVQYVTNSVPPPSSENPYLILVEPGEYDLGENLARLPAYTSLRGFDRDITILKSNNRALLINNAELSSLTIESPKDVATSSAVYFSGNVSINNVNVSGRWGVIGSSGADQRLRVYNSNIEAYFKCFSGPIVNIVMDRVNGECTTFLDTNGVNLSMTDSTTNGQITIFDGIDTSIVIKDTSVEWLSRHFVNPSPTQLISIEIDNSKVARLDMYPTSDVTVKFSEIQDVNHSAGSSFITHSLIGVLNISSGISDIVNSQIGTLNDTGGSLTCPFSYDGTYSPLSGVSC